MTFVRFEDVHKIYRTGEPVELSWRPEYAFLLDISQDATAGAHEDSF